ncbi:MAG: putative multicopper oxidase [Candidatus Eremiobacteraeota bacterium]|nr:putative multicopper oxidase [Candidatus Eremiobacteraeota bacterium]
MPPAAAQTAAPTILRAEKRDIEVLGKSGRVLRILQANGKPGLVTDVSTRFRVRLENEIGEPTLVHWHGLTPPWQQDGVPYVSAPPIAAGASASYDFPLTFGGTYWMHSHQKFQEQELMTAPLIINDAESRRADQQEIVVLLHDFTFRNPVEIFAALKKPTTASGGGMNMSGMSKMSGMTGSMNGIGRMSAPAAGMDLNDVVYDAFLANDRTLDDPEVVRVEPGGRVLLRIINGASASNFFLDLGRLTGELVAVDGHPVKPVSASVFPIAMAQRLDVRVQLPKGPTTAFPVLATLEGERKRTGIVLAAPNAKIVKIDPLATRATPPLNLDLERSLRAATPLAPKAADRIHRIALTGSMTNYVWSLNDQTYPRSKPFTVAKGERVEFAMTNTTPMSHPMHLHGHVFQVVAINGKRYSGAMRDTVLVPPKTSVTFAFDANNPGRWFYHCHNLYHMMSGMANTVVYE